MATKMINAVDGIEYRLDEIIALLTYISGVLEDVHDQNAIRITDKV